MLMALPMTCVYVKRSRWHIVSMAVMYLGMVLTGSRSGLLFGSVMLLVCFAYIYITNKKDRRFSNILLLIVSVPMIVALVKFVPQFFSARLAEGGFISADETRVKFIKLGISDFLQNPIFGVGMGNQKNIAIFPGIFPGCIVFYHNAVIQVFAALGLVGIYLTYHFGMRSGGFHCGAEWSWWGGAPGTWPKSVDAVFHSTNMGAIARMTFPLMAGMVIARKGWKIVSGAWGLWASVAILSFIFFFPEMRDGVVTKAPIDPKPFLSALGLTASRALNGGFEATAVVVGMPLVLLLGIGGEIRNARLAAVCRFLGKYSFPLYCTHYPVTILQRVWRDAHLDAPWYMHVATLCACALFAFINAYVAMKIADWAAERFRK